MHFNTTNSITVNFTKVQYIHPRLL